MSQCLGRLVRDLPRGETMLEFEQGGLFHIPLRCGNFSGRGDLCESCLKREEKTREKVAKITGTTIEGMHPALLMGRVTEPIPYWSRLYDGAWFHLKIEAGYTLSKEVMAKAKKAAELAYTGVETVAPQPMPTKRAGKKKAPAAVPLPVVVAAPVPVPVAAPPVKKAVKRPAVVIAAAVATVNTSESPLPVEEVIQVKIRKQEVDGRSLYLDPQKEKLYDLKFKYIGRLKDGAIASFPDSDAEA
jgi:hypothetical protein